MDFKDRISSCIHYFKEKINLNKNYELVDKKKKIYYFSKFSLDVNEFWEIYKFIVQFKENIFKNVLENLKYFATGKYINLFGLNLFINPLILTCFLLL